MSSSLKGAVLLVAFTTMALPACPASAADPGPARVAALEEAVRRLSSQIEQDPTDAFSFLRRGRLHRKLGEFDKALEDYDEAIRIKPRNSEAYIDRGNAWDDKAEFEKAIADYDEAIRLDSKQGWAYAFRGLAWNAKGEFDKAMADYDEAIRLDPNVPVSHRRAYPGGALSDRTALSVPFPRGVRRFRRRTPRGNGNGDYSVDAFRGQSALDGDKLRRGETKTAPTRFILTNGFCAD